MSTPSAIEALRELVREREWEQFHSAAHLAQSISIEAGELLECFQWGAEPTDDRLREELADVLSYCLLLADRLGTNVDELVHEKLALTKKKYPVEASRGRSTKYNAL